MQQIALDLRRVETPTLENFVAGPNGEALACLRALRDGAGVGAGLVYLWGETGCGKTHLAIATAGERHTLGPASAPAAWQALLDDAGERARIVAALDVERLDPPRQSLLFHLINRMRTQPASALVVTGSQPPLALALPGELRTRLGAGLVFRLRLLDDADKAAALRRVASERGVTVAPDVVPWLIAHTPRDIGALLRTFDALDRIAFEQQRAITLPLLREWLARRGPPAEAPTAASPAGAQPDAPTS